jgi:hypothetical protein
MGAMVMTFERKNLAGITTSELLEKVRKGDPFFVRTRSANVTRQLLTGLKKRYNLDVTTTQKPGGLWIIPRH